MKWLWIKITRFKRQRFAITVHREFALQDVHVYGCGMHVLSADKLGRSREVFDDDFLTLNAGKPRHDRRDFRGEILDTLEIFYGAGDATASAIADILLPDILTVDFSDAGGFLNGRQLADDVIDVELGLVTNGAVPSDCVDNDSAFSAAFPYLAVAN